MPQTAEQIDAKYGPIVAIAKSKSDPTKSYAIRQHPITKRYSCNCPSWATSPGTYESGLKTCLHTRAAAAAEGKSAVVHFNGAQTIVQAKTPKATAGAVSAVLAGMKPQGEVPAPRRAERLEAALVAALVKQGVVTIAHGGMVPGGASAGWLRKGTVAAVARVLALELPDIMAPEPAPVAPAGGVGIRHIIIED